MRKPGEEKSTKKILSKVIITILSLITLIFAAYKFTPWPSALLFRYVFEKDAEQTNLKLEKYVPKGVSEILDIQYDPNDSDAKLDVYYPHKIEKKLPVIVWIHGGGWISGDKRQSSNYLKILSAKGYIVVSIDYSIAPEKNYPLPVQQTMAALQFLEKNSNKFHIDFNSIFLAGDSAGSHIAIQTATIISDPKYAKLVNISPSIKRDKIKGLILYCGPYAVENIDLKGSFGSFLKTVLWSYSGKKDFMNDEYFKTASIIDHIGTELPPCFISAGNDDPLLIHSQALAKKLNTLNVETDTLFFPDNLTPKLPHEYQFNLDTESGKTALNRSLEFLKNNQ